MGCNHLRLLAFVLASWRVHPFESMTKAMLDIFIAAAILSPLSPIASQSAAEGADEESFERDPCPRSTIGEDGVPYRDVNGVPIAKQVTVMVEVRLDDIPE